MKKYKFKITFEDGDFGVYGLAEGKKYIKERYSIGKRMYVGDRCDGISMIQVYKVISNLEFLN